MVEFINNVPKDRLTKQKLKCIDDLVHNDLFKYPGKSSDLFKYPSKSSDLFKNPGKSSDLFKYPGKSRTLKSIRTKSHMLANSSQVYF